MSAKNKRRRGSRLIKWCLACLCRLHFSDDHLPVRCVAPQDAGDGDGRAREEVQRGVGRAEEYAADGGAEGLVPGALAEPTCVASFPICALGVSR